MGVCSNSNILGFKSFSLFCGAFNNYYNAGTLNFFLGSYAEYYNSVINGCILVGGFINSNVGQMSGNLFFNPFISNTSDIYYSAMIGQSNQIVNVVSTTLYLFMFGGEFTATTNCSYTNFFGRRITCSVTDTFMFNGITPTSGNLAVNQPGSVIFQNSGGFQMTGPKGLIVDTTTGPTYNTQPTINANSIIECRSTTKGFMPPRFDITTLTPTSPTDDGLMVFDTVTRKLCFWDTGAWRTITSLP